ncbi:tetratricopeptide repeat protein [Flavobacterium sp. 103]|uniref:tetratricopeptide repeat protein n=1 Tax=unclassified Flavobacterium TaxID=196869 RepID=UPI000D5F119C|nr:MULTISPECIES: tetratricopeptide repeat protein [unclassified Flavobacterium]PVX44334.1 tetratricopeptide repeat protein [Flavobacterium sp. 103]QKJ63552.1 tetratricopeptide repeat protein [Flavobacterium sp. M31R6]
MKSRYVIIASALFLSVASIAQKNEIKAAEKALKAGKSDEAITILTGAEYLSVNAPDAEKAQFLFVKGNAHLDLANKNVEADKNLSLAAKAFQELLEAEKASGKAKYSTQAAASIAEIKGKLINSAIEDTKANKDADGAKKLYEAYLLEKKDTINLYYAASTYVNAKDYDTALKLYEELKVLNYSGKATYYYAVNKVNNQEDYFTTAADRDRLVKMGTHEKPRNENVPSKRGEIYKNVALIYVQQGKMDLAKKAVSDARKANPEDTSLILTEANLYLESKDMVTYKKLISEALEKNPNDVDLIFNLGVVSAGAKNYAEAEKFYTKVMELDPKYINAYINMAAMKLDDEKGIIDEMNKLGNSADDMKRYNVLKKKREDLFRSTIPYLEKAVALDPKNVDVAKTLLNVYSALEMTTEYKTLKAKM